MAGSFNGAGTDYAPGIQRLSGLCCYQPAGKGEVFCAWCGRDVGGSNSGGGRIEHGRVTRMATALMTGIACLGREEEGRTGCMQTACCLKAALAGSLRLWRTSSVERVPSSAWRQHMVPGCSWTLYAFLLLLLERTVALCSPRLSGLSSRLLPHSSLPLPSATSLLYFVLPPGAGRQDAGVARTRCRAATPLRAAQRRLPRLPVGGCAAAAAVLPRCSTLRSNSAALPLDALRQRVALALAGATAACSCSTGERAYRASVCCAAGLCRLRLASWRCARRLRCRLPRAAGLERRRVRRGVPLTSARALLR